MYTEKDLRQLADEYYEEGLKFYEEKRIVESIKLFQNAGKVYQKIGEDKKGCEVLIMLGLAHSLCGNDELSIDLFFEILEIVDRCNLDFIRARVYNNIGTRFQQLNDFESAIYYYHLAEVELKKIDPKSEEKYDTTILAVFLNLAQVYYDTRNYEKGKVYIEKCKESFKNLDKSSYYYTFLLIQSEIDYGLGNIFGIEDKLDEVIKGIQNEGDRLCYSENTINLSKLLGQMSDFERWEKVLVAFGEYTEANNDEYLLMLNARLWCEYFKAKDDIVNYNKTCVEYAEANMVFKEKLDKTRVAEIRTKIDYKQFNKRLSDDGERTDFDDLTGVGSRVKFENDFQGLLIESKSNNDKVGVGIVNMDFFQYLNDKYGHLKGDESLKKVAEAIKEVVGEFGMVYRFGGDEFILLLSNCSIPNLKKIAESIKSAIHRLRIPNEKSAISSTLTVSQGYIYMRPERSVGADALVRFAIDALDAVRKKGRNDYLILEEGKDYHLFYNKYNKNLEAADELETYYRMASDREEWLMNLQQRSLKIHELFEDNEALIDHYLKPLFEGVEQLNEESATAIFEEINAMYQAGKRDYVVVMQVAELLAEYFKAHDMIEDHISTIIILLSEYKQLDHSIYYDKTMELYEYLDKYKDSYEQITKRNVRRQLCVEYFKQGIFIAENPNTSLRTCLDIIKSEFEFFDAKNLAEDLRFAEEDKIMGKSKFIVQMLSANMTYLNEQDKDNADYQEAFSYLSEIYDREISNGVTEFNLDTRFIGAYYRCKWLLEQISLRDCFDKYKDYFYYTYSNPSLKRMDSTVELSKQRLFQLMIYYVPEMIFISNGLLGTDDEVSIGIIDDLLDKYVAYIKTLPITGNETCISKNLASSLTMISSYVSDEIDIYELLFEVIVGRDVDVTIHSKMVSGISKLIVELVIRNNPSLLIGCMDFENEEQVAENWPKVVKFIEKAGMIHDIGKIDISDITKTQTRRLNNFEMENIRRHPECGARMVRNSEEMKQYLPIILGHHKAWNDKDGYPRDYKYLENPNPLLVNIIQLSDSLDAATDSVGRHYAKTKSVEEVLKELHDEEGSRYNPDLVKMMMDDKKFVEDLKEIVSEGRQEICYELYNTYMG